MTERFRDRYRRPSARLRNWDYSADGIYFITICTAGHEYFFGEIVNKKMVLSEIGTLVQREWEKSFEVRAELFCDWYVIMPNHIHAILRIENGNNETMKDELQYLNSPDIRDEQIVKPFKFGVAYRSPKSISSFVAGFKSVVTVKAHKIQADFGWQTRFHDHIIHNNQEYQRIADYIAENPATWEHDKFYREE